MRKLLVLATMFALAACSGGGGSSAGPSSPGAPVNPPYTGPLVTPSFVLVFPTAPSSSSQTRSAQQVSPNRVSPATLSVTIVFTNPPTGLSPTSVTTAITPASCPCTVNAPPSPPGRSDSYQIDTFDASNGTGNDLDRGSATFTPIAGQNNPQTVVLKGIPATVTITNVPGAFNAGTGSQTATLAITAKDAAGQTIASGTYLNAITVSDPDTIGTQGSRLTGTNAGTCTGTCVVMNGPADVATLNYGGRAENPVTLSATGTGVTTGTATFTPVLSAITWQAGPTSTLGGKGIDLFTNDSLSTVGYSGVESYSELGYTESPYLQTLTTINGGSCAAFATLAATNNANNTDFTATAIASPVAGQCTRVVSDGLSASGHGSGGPSFLVTYTTGSIGASARQRHP